MSAAARPGLRVIEDAAYCIGGEYRGRRIGSFGDTQVFSFHPNKNITTGEGGCVVTRDAKMQRDIKLLRFHGIDREATSELARRGLPHYEIGLAGYQFNMMDLQAALGLHQLPRLDAINDRRRRLADRYRQALAACPGLRCPRTPAYPHTHAWHLFAPLVEADASGASRDDLMLCLRERGMGTGLHYQAIHLSSFYAKRYGWTRGDFPNAEYISDRVVSLPQFPDMTEADQDRVVVALAAIFGEV